MHSNLCLWVCGTLTYMLYPRIVPLCCHNADPNPRVQIPSIREDHAASSDSTGQWVPGEMKWNNTEATLGGGSAPPRYYISQWEMWPQNEETMRYVNLVRSSCCGVVVAPIRPLA